MEVATVPACLGSAPGWLAAPPPLGAPGDAEGERLPEQLPEVVDAHVHLFPDGFFEAIWRWFESYGWPIRYKLPAPKVLEFLFARGVSKVVGLHYAHKPGVSRILNRYLAELAKQEPRLIGLATVFPGEEGAQEILEEAFALGLRGVKLHCHVQCFSPDSEAMDVVYRACAKAKAPLVIHAGREPKSPHYKCDPHQICSADRVDRALRSYPGIKLCVPHLGADEFDAYERLLERHDNLWLDTTMALAEYFPAKAPVRLLHARPERILYGTDFPNLPYAWDREIKKISGYDLPEHDLAKLVGQNALSLFGDKGPSPPRDTISM